MSHDGGTIESGDLRVVFEWHGDRFRHFVERRVAGRWKTVLVSLEGEPHDVWPCSPPLQTLQMEQRSGEPVALLVGRAGSGHWSASVEPRSNAMGLLFDLACRVSAAPSQLGVTYLSFGESLDIVGEPRSSEVVRVETGPSGGLCVRPIKSPVSFPATVRWRYRIRFAS